MAMVMVMVMVMGDTSVVDEVWPKPVHGSLSSTNQLWQFDVESLHLQPAHPSRLQEDGDGAELGIVGMGMGMEMEMGMDGIVMGQLG